MIPVGGTLILGNDPGENWDVAKLPNVRGQVARLRDRLARVRAASPRPGMLR